MPPLPPMPPPPLPVPPAPPMAWFAVMVTLLIVSAPVELTNTAPPSPAPPPAPVPPCALALLTVRFWIDALVVPLPFCPASPMKNTR